ncbi:MAG: hypothetical protein R3B84_09985 [Zavarzinella sp.]
MSKRKSTVRPNVPEEEQRKIIAALQIGYNLGQAKDIMYHKYLSIPDGKDKDIMPGSAELSDKQRQLLMAMPRSIPAQEYLKKIGQLKNFPGGWNDYVKYFEKSYGVLFQNNNTVGPIGNIDELYRIIGAESKSIKMQEVYFALVFYLPRPQLYIHNSSIYKYNDLDVLNQFIQSAKMILIYEAMKSLSKTLIKSAKVGLLLYELEHQDRFVNNGELPDGCTIKENFDSSLIQQWMRTTAIQTSPDATIEMLNFVISNKTKEQQLLDWWNINKKVFLQPLASYTASRISWTVETGELNIDGHTFRFQVQKAVVISEILSGFQLQHWSNPLLKTCKSDEELNQKSKRFSDAISEIHNKINNEALTFQKRVDKMSRIVRITYVLKD